MVHYLAFINVSSFSYDLSADDKRFLVLMSDAQRPEVTHLNLVVNWFEEGFHHVRVRDTLYASLTSHERVCLVIVM